MHHGQAIRCCVLGEDILQLPIMEGALSNASREINTLGAVGNGDPGRTGGGTYSMPGGGDNRKDPTIQDYENIFGPAARYSSLQCFCLSSRL